MPSTMATLTMIFCRGPCTQQCGDGTKTDRLAINAKRELQSSSAKKGGKREEEKRKKIKKVKNYRILFLIIDLWPVTSTVSLSLSLSPKGCSSRSSNSSEQAMSPSSSFPQVCKTGGSLQSTTTTATATDSQPALSDGPGLLHSLPHTLQSA